MVMAMMIIIIMIIIIVKRYNILSTNLNNFVVDRFLNCLRGVRSYCGVVHKIFSLFILCQACHCDTFNKLK